MANAGLLPDPDQYTKPVSEEERKLRLAELENIMVEGIDALIERLRQMEPK